MNLCSLNSSLYNIVRCEKGSGSPAKTDHRFTCSFQFLAFASTAKVALGAIADILLEIRGFVIFYEPPLDMIIIPLKSLVYYPVSFFIKWKHSIKFLR